MLTIATFANRAVAEGWIPLDRTHQGQGIISATFKQDGIILTGTFYPAIHFGVESFSVNLSDSSTGNFVCMSVNEDHTNTSFSMGWALSELSPRYSYDDEFEYCECEMCRPDLYLDDDIDPYEPIHPYEDYDPELAR